MTTETSTEPATYLSPKYWFGPYALVVSVLYLWGYWGSFRVNVLEYIGVTEIVKTAVYPIVSAFVFFAIGAILGEILTPHGYLPAGGGAHTSTGKWLRKHVSWLASALAVLVVLVAWFAPISKWQILPVLFATFVTLPLKKAGLLHKEIGSDSIRTVTLYLLAMLAPFAYGRGLLVANEVLSGNRFSYTTSELPGQKIAASVKTNERPRYLGMANDRYIFLNPLDQSVSYVATSEVKSLVLKQFDGQPPLADQSVTSSVNSASAAAAASTGTTPVPSASAVAAASSNAAASAAASESSPTKK